MIDKKMKDYLMNESSNLQLVIRDEQLERLAELLITKVFSRHQELVADENDNTYLNTDAVCEMLGVHRTTLAKWVKSGYINRVKVGKRNNYRLSDVLKIKEGKR